MVRGNASGKLSSNRLKVNFLMNITGISLLWSEAYLIYLDAILIMFSSVYIVSNTN